MLKAWNFTSYKLRHRCFDNNLQKDFRTNIIGSDAADTFNGRIMLRPKLQNLYVLLEKYLSLNLKAVLYPLAEANSRPSYASQTELLREYLKYLN